MQNVQVKKQLPYSPKEFYLRYRLSGQTIEEFAVAHHTDPWLARIAIKDPERVWPHITAARLKEAEKSKYPRQSKFMARVMGAFNLRDFSALTGLSVSRVNRLLNGVFPISDSETQLLSKFLIIEEAQEKTNFIPSSDLFRPRDTPAPTTDVAPVFGKFGKTTRDTQDTINSIFGTPVQALRVVETPIEVKERVIELPAYKSLESIEQDKLSEQTYDNYLTYGLSKREFCKLFEISIEELEAIIEQFTLQ